MSTATQTPRTFTQRAAQGELGFERLPDHLIDHHKKIVVDQAARVHPTANHLIIGHSETGHHHVLSPERCQLYHLPDSLTKLLIVKETDHLTHLRPHDTHIPLEFQPGNYLVRHLREYVPGSLQRQATFRGSLD